MRAESDLQGSHRHETPGCPRCGLPLMAEAQFCPYCERWLREGALQRLFRRRPAATSGDRPEPRRILGISEPLLLSVGLVVFALIAAASIIVAITT